MASPPPPTKGGHVVCSACVEKLITVKPLSRGRCPPYRGWFPAENFRKVGENEIFSCFSSFFISNICPVIKQNENIYLLRIVKLLQFSKLVFFICLLYRSLF